MRQRLILFILILLFSFSANAFETKAKQAYMIDADTGYVMLDKNAHDPMPPASMSKLMTTYVLFDAIKKGRVSLDDEFTVSDRAWKIGGAASGSSTMFLKPNQKVKVADLIRGIIIQSGNDACIVVAENMAGSEEAFAIILTQKGKELGLENSTFKNATGLPDPEHMMTPKDLTVLAKALINDFPEFYPIYSEKEFTYNTIKQGNRNPLLYTIKGAKADGLKTGHTKESGYGLTGSVITPEGRRLIMVVNGLKTQNDRYNETQKMVNWGLAAFENTTLFSAGKTIESIPVWLGIEKNVPAVIDRDLIVTIPRGTKSGIRATINYDTPVSAPVKRGQKIGTLTVKIPDQPDRIMDLVAGKDIEKVGYFGKLKALFNNMIGR
ncbi:MAG: D-alanyl-D-alanine carboxypeptidase [Lactobacillales bacterium]|nr:D-alanyl-D-alanine carboxypeptidase [Lactobacillales bacterium]